MDLLAATGLGRLQTGHGGGLHAPCARTCSRRDTIVLWSAPLPRWPSRLGGYLSARLVLAADRRFGRLALRADRYDGRFLLAVGGVLGFTLLTYWSLTLYWDVAGLASEDGLSEWWTVATYLASAGMAAAPRESGEPLTWGRKILSGGRPIESY